MGRAIRDGITEGVAAEARYSFRAAAIGAVLGAVTVGGVMAWLIGFQGLLYGAPIGAVVGAVGIWLLYLNITS